MVLIAHGDRALIRLARQRCPKELRLVVTSTIAEAQRQVTRHAPLQGAIVGVRLCDGDGIALALELRARAPELPIVVMTRRLCRKLANRLFVTGLGYVVTPAQPPCIDVFFERARIAHAPASATIVSPAGELMVLPSAELERMVAQTAASPILQGIVLSRRQLEVLALALAGFDEKEMAVQLGISRYTVAMHRRALGEKTGVPVLRELARRVRCGEPLPAQRVRRPQGRMRAGSSSSRSSPPMRSARTSPARSSATSS